MEGVEKPKENFGVVVAAAVVAGAVVVASVADVDDCAGAVSKAKGNGAEVGVGADVAADALEGFAGSGLATAAVGFATEMPKLNLGVAEGPMAEGVSFAVLEAAGLGAPNKKPPLAPVVVDGAASPPTRGRRLLAPEPASGLSVVFFTPNGDEACCGAPNGDLSV